MNEQLILDTTRYTVKEVSHMLDTLFTDSTVSTDSEYSSDSDSEFNLSDPEVLLARE